jgi:uncharacterized protein (TIGR02271 family)
MTLHKIKDFDPNYQEHFDKSDIIGFDIYTGQEKIGSVADILVGETGNLRYLVINTGMLALGKKVLLPIGKAKFDHNSKRVYVEAFSKTQVDNLPEYKETDVIDYDYEEKVRNVYRTSKMNSATNATMNSEHDRNTYAYSRDAALYDLNDNDHQNLRLYEERLIADKTRRKTGEVTLGKRVETERATVSVPLDKERVIVERTTPHDPNVAVTPDAGAFQEGEIARMEVYEETANIRKEAFVREEVNVKKIVEKETATGEEQLRRELLEVTSDGKPVVRDNIDETTKVKR